MIKGPSILVRYRDFSLSLECHEGEGLILENVPQPLASWFVAYGAKTPLPLPILPLYVSSFTERVLQSMQKVPFGEIISYRQLAELLGQPKAVRAVASACGRNPFPILIPCHRIVGSQGLGGFSCGLEVKRRLLIHELGMPFAPSHNQTEEIGNDRNRNFEKDIRARVSARSVLG